MIVSKRHDSYFLPQENTLKTIQLGGVSDHAPTMPRVENSQPQQ